MSGVLITLSKGLAGGCLAGFGFVFWAVMVLEETPKPRVAAIIVGWAMMAGLCVGVLYL